MATLSPLHYSSHLTRNRNTSNHNNTSTNPHRRPPSYRKTTHGTSICLTTTVDTASSKPTLPSSPLSSAAAGQLVSPDESRQSCYIYRASLNPLR
jgi:hypothetical protein